MLTWVTDTAYDEGSASFAAGCRMLAHEAWFSESNPRNRDIHSSAAQAAQVSADAGIDRLLLIHLPPFVPVQPELLFEAQAQVPCALMADDGADVSMLLGDNGLPTGSTPARAPSPH
jgi:ribonuclease Z